MNEIIAQELEKLNEVRGSERKPKDIMKLKQATNHMKEVLDEHLPGFMVIYIDTLRQHVLVLKKTWQL